MKKLILVDLPKGRELVVMTRKGEGYIPIVQEYTEVPLTPSDIDYLLTLCNFNENGEQYADPNRDEILEKVKMMR